MDSTIPGKKRPGSTSMEMDTGHSGVDRIMMDGTVPGRQIVNH